PDAVLGGCTIMMFGSIVTSGIEMLTKCGTSKKNITITALSLSVGIGFTQIPEMFNAFPQIVQTVFNGNCVAVVFVIALVLSLCMKDDKAE
ncbi:MAG: purine permease, partial [Treponema sp.]|nr:purine permease [Candidatus Treponema equifaecale]